MLLKLPLAIGAILVGVTVFSMCSCLAQPGATATGELKNDPIQPLTIRGENFVDPAGNAVRFWGVNVVAAYPDHSTADALAKNLASLQVNLVRPHHNLRPSKDWNPQMSSGALLKYQGNSREFDEEALERFDYLNAAFRRNGIYLAMSINWTRRYLPGDVDILKTSDADQEAWAEAMKELNGWDWRKGFDVYKMLPVIDERAALLNEEFARRFLTHVNPHTGVAYGKDPQVLTIELMNEASTEYAIICGNKFPDYWQKELIARWEAYARKAGIAPGDLYKPANATAKTVRANFLRELDAAYFERIKKVIHEAGCTVPLTFSNLWRGENALDMHEKQSDWIENHIYDNPLVTSGADDFISKLDRSAVAGKPFFVGEINQSENKTLAAKENPVRSMLPLATAAYGSLHNWSGVVWFAWLHGGKMLGSDGWATEESRSPNLGQMISDGMQIDHLRTTGILFRRGLLARSTQPITIHVDEPFTAGDYHGLMREKYEPRAGWQNIHAIRKTFGPAPAAQAKDDWLTRQPESPLVSDTGEIVKEIQRSQLTIAAPKAEAFSGMLDEAAPRGLRVLHLKGSGFATVVMVAYDNQPLESSQRIILSRTATESTGVESDGPVITLQGLKQATGTQWSVRVTRSRGEGRVSREPSKIKTKPTEGVGNAMELPAGDWTECELQLQR